MEMLLDFVHLTEGQAQALHYALHVEKWEVSPDIGIPRVEIIDDVEEHVQNNDIIDSDMEDAWWRILMMPFAI